MWLSGLYPLGDWDSLSFFPFFSNHFIVLVALWFWFRYENYLIVFKQHKYYIRFSQEEHLVTFGLKIHLFTM